MRRITEETAGDLLRCIPLLLSVIDRQEARRNSRLGNAVRLTKRALKHIERAKGKD